MSRHALEPLMEHHRRLDALFQEHQEALVGLEVDRARERLLRYRAALLAHMAFEEEHVLPRYAELPRLRGAGVEYFSGEHEKLRNLLDEVSEIVDALRADAPDRSRIVAAFDRSALFKGLLEHHDLREDQFLYPRLADHLGPEACRALIARAPAPP
jgi:hemerythrin-like domain-containing protein